MNKHEHSFVRWVGQAIAGLLLWMVSKMIKAKKDEVGKRTKFVASAPSDLTTMDSIVAAQHGVNTIYDIVHNVNVSLLKLWSIWLANAPKVSRILFSKCYFFIPEMS
ncbi:hypothetical protein Hanom_Chr13g01227641 [Helianthus anomalus]